MQNGSSYRQTDAIGRPVVELNDPRCAGFIKPVILSPVCNARRVLGIAPERGMCMCKMARPGCGSEECKVREWKAASASSLRGRIAALQDLLRDAPPQRLERLEDALQTSLSALAALETLLEQCRHPVPRHLGRPALVSGRPHLRLVRPD